MGKWCHGLGSERRKWLLSLSLFSCQPSFSGVRAKLLLDFLCLGYVLLCSCYTPWRYVGMDLHRGLDGVWGIFRSFGSMVTYGGVSLGERKGSV